MVNICRVCIRHIGPDREPVQPLCKFQDFGWNLITAQILACFPDVNLKIAVRNPLVVCVECAQVIGTFSVLRFRVQEAQKVLQAFRDLNRQSFQQTGKATFGYHGLDLVAVAAMCESVIKAEPIVVKSDRFVQLVGSKKVIIRNKNDEKSIAPSSNQRVSNNPRSSKITSRIREPENKPNTSSDVTPTELGSNLPKTPTFAHKIKTRQQTIAEPDTPCSSKSNAAISNSTIPSCSTEDYSSLRRLLKSTVQDEDKPPSQGDELSTESIAAVSEANEDTLREPIYVYGKPGPKFTKHRATECFMKSSTALHVPDQTKLIHESILTKQQAIETSSTQLQSETENMIMPNLVTENSIEFAAEENASSCKEGFSSPTRLSDSYDSHSMDHSPIHDSSPELLEIYKEIPYKEPRFGGRRKKRRTNRLFFKFPKKKIKLKMPLITSVVSLSGLHGVSESDILPQEQDTIAGMNTTIHVQDEVSSFSNDFAVVQSADPQEFLVETIANFTNASFEAINSEEHNDVPADRRGTLRVGKNLVAQEVPLSQEDTLNQKDLTQLITYLFEDSSVDDPTPSASVSTEEVVCSEAPIIDLGASENMDDTTITSLNGSVISKRALADTSFDKESCATTPTISASFESVTTRYGRRIKPTESYFSFSKRRKLTRAVKPADCTVSPEGVSVPVRITFEGQKAFLERLKLKLVSPQKISKALALNLQKEIVEDKTNSSGDTTIVSIAKVAEITEDNWTTTIKNPRLSFQTEVPSFTVHPIANNTAYSKNVKTKSDTLNMTTESLPTVDDIGCVNEQALKEDNNKQSTVTQPSIPDSVVKEDNVQTKSVRAKSVAPLELHYKDIRNTGVRGSNAAVTTPILEPSVNESTYKTRRVRSKSVAPPSTGATPKTRANNSNAEVSAPPVNENNFKTRRARAKSVPRLALTKRASTIVVPALALERIDNGDISKTRRARAKSLAPLDKKDIRTTRVSRSTAVVSALMLEEPVNENNFNTRRVRAKSVSRINVDKAALITQASNSTAEIPGPTLEQPHNEEDWKSRRLRSKSVTPLNVRNTELITRSNSTAEVPLPAREQSVIENYSKTRMVRSKSITRLDVRKTELITSNSTAEVSLPILVQSVIENYSKTRLGRSKSVTRLDVKKGAMITSSSNSAVEYSPPTLEHGDANIRKVRAKSMTRFNVNKAALMTSKNNSNTGIAPPTPEQPAIQTESKTRMVKVKSLTYINSNKAVLITTASNSAAEVPTETLEQPLNEADTNTRKVREKLVLRLDVNKAALKTTPSKSATDVTARTLEQPVNEADTNTRRVRARSVTRLNVNKEAMITAVSKSAAEVTPPTSEEPVNEADTNTSRVRAKSISRLNVNKDAAITAASNSAANVTATTLEQPLNETDTNTRKVREKSVLQLAVNKAASKTTPSKSATDVTPRTLEQPVNESDTITTRVRAKSMTRFNVNKDAPAASHLTAEVTAGTLQQQANETNTNNRRVRAKSVSRLSVNKAAPITATSKSAAEVITPTLEQQDNEADTITRRVRAKSITRLNKDSPAASYLTADVIAPTVEQRVNEADTNTRRVRAKSVPRLIVNKEAMITSASKLATEVIPRTPEQPVNEANTYTRRVRAKSVTRLIVNKKAMITSASKLAAEVTPPTLEQPVNEASTYTIRVRAKSISRLYINKDAPIAAASNSAAEVIPPTLDQPDNEADTNDRRVRAKPVSRLNVNKATPKTTTNELAAEITAPTLEQLDNECDSNTRMVIAKSVTRLNVNKDEQIAAASNSATEVIPPTLEEPNNEADTNTRRVRAKSVSRLNVNKDALITQASKSTAEIPAPTLEQSDNEADTNTRNVRTKSIKRHIVNKDAPIAAASNSAAEVIVPNMKEPGNEGDINTTRIRANSVTRLKANKIAPMLIESNSDLTVTAPTTNKLVINTRRIRSKSFVLFDVIKDALITAANRTSCATREISFPTVEQSINKDTSKTIRARAKSFTSFDVLNDIPSSSANSSTTRVPKPTVDQFVRQDSPKIQKIRTQPDAQLEVNNDLPLSVASSLTIAVTTSIVKQTVTEDKTLMIDKFRAISAKPIDINKVSSTTTTSSSTAEMPTSNVDQVVKEATSMNRKNSAELVTPLDVNKDSSTTLGSSSIAIVTTPSVNQVVKEESSSARKVDIKSVIPRGVYKGPSPTTASRSTAEVPITAVHQIVEDDISKIRNVESKSVAQLDVSKDLPKIAESSSTAVISSPTVVKIHEKVAFKTANNEGRLVPPINDNKDSFTTASNSTFRIPTPTVESAVKEDTFKLRKIGTNSVAPLDTNKYSSKIEVGSLIVDFSTSSTEQIAKRDTSKVREIKAKSVGPLDANNLLMTIGSSSIAKVLTPTFKEDNCNTKKVRAKLVASPHVNKDLPKTIASTSTAEVSTRSMEEEIKEDTSKKLKVTVKPVELLDVKKDLPKSITSSSIAEILTSNMKEEDTSKDRKLSAKLVSPPDINKDLLASIGSSSRGKVPTLTVEQVVKEDTYKAKKNRAKLVSTPDVNKGLLASIENSPSSKVPMQTIELIVNEENSKSKAAAAPDVSKDLPKTIASSSTAEVSSMEQETKNYISKNTKVRTKSVAPLDLNKDLQTTVTVVQVFKEDISKVRKVRGKPAAPLDVNQEIPTTVASSLFTEVLTPTIEQVVKENNSKASNVKAKSVTPSDIKKDSSTTVGSSLMAEVTTPTVEEVIKSDNSISRKVKTKSIAPRDCKKDIPTTEANSSFTEVPTPTVEQVLKEDISKAKEVKTKLVVPLDVNKDLPKIIASISTVEVLTSGIEQEAKEDTFKKRKVGAKLVALLDVDKDLPKSIASSSTTEVSAPSMKQEAKEDTAKNRRDGAKPVVKKDNAKARRVTSTSVAPLYANNDVPTTVRSSLTAEILTSVEQEAKEDTSKNIKVRTKSVSPLAVNKDKLLATTVASSSSTEDPTLTVDQVAKEDSSKVRKVRPKSVAALDIHTNLPKVLAGSSTAEIRTPTVEHLVKENSWKSQKVQAKSVATHEVNRNVPTTVASSLSTEVLTPTLRQVIKEDNSTATSFTPFDVNKDLSTTIGSSAIAEVTTPTVEQAIKTDNSKSRKVRTKSIAPLDGDKDIPTTVANSSATVVPTPTVDRVVKEDICNVLKYRAKSATLLRVHKDLCTTIASSSTVEVPTPTFEHVVKKDSSFKTRKVRVKSVAPLDVTKDLPTTIASSSSTAAPTVHVHKYLPKIIASNPTDDVPAPTVEHIFKEDMSNHRKRAKSVAPFDVYKDLPMIVASRSSTEVLTPTVEQVDISNARKIGAKSVTLLDVHQDLPKVVASNSTAELPTPPVEHFIGEEDSTKNRNVRAMSVTPLNVDKDAQITTESSSTAKVQNPTVEKIVKHDNSSIRKVKIKSIVPLLNATKDSPKTTGSSMTSEIGTSEASKTGKVIAKSDALLDAYKSSPKTAQSRCIVEVPPLLVEQLVRAINKDLPKLARSSSTVIIPMAKENKTQAKKVIAKPISPDSSVTSATSATAVVSSPILELTVKEEGTKPGLIRGKFVVPLHVDKDTSTNSDCSLTAEVPAQILEQTINEDKSKSSKATPISIAKTIVEVSSMDKQGIFEDCGRAKDKICKPVDIKKVSDLNFVTTSDANAAALAITISTATDSSKTRNVRDKLNILKKRINEKAKSNEIKADAPVPELVCKPSEVPKILLSPGKGKCKNESLSSWNLIKANDTKEVEKQIAIKCPKEIAIVISPAEQSLARAQLTTAENYFCVSKEFNEGIDVETSKSDLPEKFGKPTEHLGDVIAKSNASDQFDKSKEDVNENLISELEEFECDLTNATKKTSSVEVNLFQNEIDGISKLPSTLVGSEIVPAYCNSIYLEDISNDGSDSTEVKQDDIEPYNLSSQKVISPSGTEKPVILSEPNVRFRNDNTKSPTTSFSISAGRDKTLPDGSQDAKKSIEINQVAIEPTSFQNEEGTGELFLQETTFLRDTTTFETNKQLPDQTRDDATKLSQDDIVYPIQEVRIEEISPKEIATPKTKDVKSTDEIFAACDQTSEIPTVEAESIISSENQETFTKLSIQTAVSIADRIPAILAKPEVTQDDIESVISSLVKGSSNTICVQETPCPNAVHAPEATSLESVKTSIVPEILTNDLDDNNVSRQDVANYMISCLVQEPTASKDDELIEINNRLCDSGEIVEAEEGSPLIFEDPVMPRASDIFDTVLTKVAPSKHPAKRRRKNSDPPITQNISQPFDLPKTKVRRVSIRSKEPAKNDKVIKQNIPKQSRRRTIKSRIVMQQLSPFTDSSQDHTQSPSIMSTPDTVNSRDCFLESVGKSPNDPPAAVLATMDATAIGISQTLKEFWAEFNTSLESPGKSSQDQFIDSMCLPEVFAEVTLPYLDAEQDLCVDGSNLEDITPTLIAEPKVINDLGCITSTAQAYLGIQANPQQVMPTQYENVDSVSYQQLDNFNLEDILRNKIECTPTNITSVDNTTSEFIANMLPDNNETYTSTDYLPETDQNLNESGISKALPKPIPVLLSISGKSGRQSIKILKVSNAIENSNLQEKFMINPETLVHPVTPPKVTSNEHVSTDIPKQVSDQKVSLFQLQNTSLSPNSSLMLLVKPGDVLDSPKSTLINQQPVASYNDKSKAVLLSHASKVLLSPEYKPNDISTPLILVTLPASAPAQINSNQSSLKTIVESLPLNTLGVSSATAKCTEPITNPTQSEKRLDRKVSKKPARETKTVEPKSPISVGELNYEKTRQKMNPKSSVNRVYVRKRVSKISMQPLIDPPKNSSGAIASDTIKKDHSKDFLKEYSKYLLNDASKQESTSVSNQVPKKGKPKPLASFTSVIVSPAAEASPLIQVIPAEQKPSSFKKYSCEICRFDFALESSLSKHKEWHCKWGGLYQCKYCVERYDNLEQLNKHATVHGQIHHCTNCYQRFFSAECLSGHVQSQHGIYQSNVYVEPEVLCPDCGRLITVTVLPFHLDWHEPESLVQCAICTAFTLRMDRHMHWNDHHHNGKQFVCSLCGESYSTKQTLCWHLENHSSKCRLCGKDIKKMEFGEEHTCPRNIRRPYKRRKQQKMLASLRNKRALKCKSCPKAYYSRDLLRKHAYRMHKECDQCGQVCFSEIVLQAHKIKVHNIDINAQFALCTRSYKSNNEIIEEAERFMSRVSRQQLKPTLPRSSLSKRAKKITCDLCGHVCQSYASLSAHRRYHRKQRGNRSKQHMESSEDRGGFECRVCGVVFGSKLSRLGHMAIHTCSPRKFNIVRRTPGSSISQPKQQQTSRGCTSTHKLSQEKLSSPLLTTTEISSDDSDMPMLSGGPDVQKADPLVLPHICQICDKSFKSSKQLSIHINIHGSIKRFNCSHCEKHFFSVDGLKEHESGSHPGKPQPPPPQRTATPAPPPSPVASPTKATTSNQYKPATAPPTTLTTAAAGSRSPRRTHACHCGEQFLSLATLRKHKVLKHPNKGSADHDVLHKGHSIAGDALLGDRNTSAHQW